MVDGSKKENPTMSSALRAYVFLVIAVTSSFGLPSSQANVSVVLVWAPSETRFDVDDVKSSLYNSIRLRSETRILSESELYHYFMNDYQKEASWLIFVDLREYACPEGFFRKNVIAYVSVTQMACPHLSNATKALWTRVDTTTFNREQLVTDFSNISTSAIGSLALLYDQTGEEYFHEHSASLRLPLIFQINIALDNCSATEHLKNLTAKTEIRDLVVVAHSDCISALLQEISPFLPMLLTLSSLGDEVNYLCSTVTKAYSLQLMFGRYRWLLYTTNSLMPSCKSCQNVNAILFTEKNRPRDLPATRHEKILRFIDKSLEKLDMRRTHFLDAGSMETCYQNCTHLCTACVLDFKDAMSKVEGEETMVFFLNNTEARNNLWFTVFQVTGNGSQMVANWSQSTGLSSGVVLFPHSKSDIVLRAVVVEEPPFVFRVDTPEGPTYKGYSLDVLEGISKYVGFTYVIRECENNEYGVSRGNGNWSGCVGNVVRGEADVIVGALTVTAEREDVVDFTLPYYDFAGIQILMKKPDTYVNIFYFVDVFTMEAWLCLFGVIILTSVLLFVFEKFTPRDNSRTDKHSAEASSRHQAKAFDLKESIWFVIGSITLAGGGEPPRCLASRLLVAGFWFFSVVIMSTFTANLAAFLTVSRMGTKIASLDELAGQSDVRYSVVRESNVMAYFEHQAAIERNFYELWKNMSLGGSIGGSSGLDGIVDDKNLAVWDYPLGDKFGNMWNAIKTTGLLNSTQEGVDRVMKGNFALITESPVIKYLTFKSCSLTAVGDQFSIRPYAFALKDKSLFTSKFTSAILQLQKDRDLENLKRKWWDDDKVSCPTESNDQGLDLSSLTGTFIVMGGGMCLGLIILGVELLIHRRAPRQPQKAEVTSDKELESTKTVSYMEPTSLPPVTLNELDLTRELNVKYETRESL